MWRKGNPRALLMGMSIGTATMENDTEDPQKLKTRTTTQSSNFISGYLPEENKNTNSKRYMHLCVHCSIIYKSQGVEATKVSIER